MEMEPWDPLDHPARIEVRRQESDDSDAEGGLGNVTRVVLRPPGHSGKAKRGHLCFDASYEGGNLGRVDFISEYEYDLFIRPDTCNPRYRLWFNFVVDNVRADQKESSPIPHFSRLLLRRLTITHPTTYRLKKSPKYGMAQD
ncbi:Cytosolic carboxypeptidase 6 [Folsomia candida]|uniref:Cytosolic carboxypeptidase 6 n=1 Tax=Folsomia candida TaxID=158441 RepID=A0A226E450_FOLCA|nr:Cytosolic carboxypeptidase 6 [Folsomia candida]